jgi:sodium-dependent dicarboxylate transporter 2/3/5
VLLAKSFPPTTAGLQLEHASEKITVRGSIIVSLFIATVILWMTDRWHGLPSAVVALLPAVVLTATGLFTREDLGRLEWGILILIAGGVSLGAGIQLAGVDRLVVQWMPTFEGSGFLLLTMLVMTTMIIGTFMSNTAAANLIIPIGISSAALSETGGFLSPVQASISIALAASISMALPVSTPPNAIAYARGEFTTREMARTALVVGALGALLIVAGGGLVMRIWGIVN